VQRRFGVPEIGAECVGRAVGRYARTMCVGDDGAAHGALPTTEAFQHRGLGRTAEEGMRLNEVVT
jgi:hypothetical protein